MRAHASFPLPVAAPQSTRPDRDLWCRRYDQCLDVAIARDWDGFSCGACPIRGTERIAPPPVVTPGNWSHTGRRPEDSVLAHVAPSELRQVLARGPATIEDLEAELAPEGRGPRVAIRRALEILVDGFEAWALPDGRFQLTRRGYGETANER